MIVKCESFKPTYRWEENMAARGASYVVRWLTTKREDKVMRCVINIWAFRFLLSFFFFLHCWSLIVLIRLLMKFLWRWDLLAWLRWKHYFASTIGSKWKDIVKVACEIWVFSFICVCVFCEHHHKNCSGNHLDRCPPHIFAMFAIFSALSFPWPKFTDQLSSL